jgi:hypothetical protein
MNVSLPPIADIRSAVNNSAMTERYVDPEIIRGFLKVRDDLLFWLTEQAGPAPEQTEPLWEAYRLLDKGLEEVKREAGFVEDLTVYKPDRT